MTTEQGDVLRVTCKMSVGVDDVQNVYHFEAQGSGSLSDALTLSLLASGLDGTYDEIDLLITDELSFDTIEVYNLTQDTYVGEANWPILTVGGGLNEMLPPQTCLFTLFNTDVLNSQGRKFLPPTTVDYLGADGTPLGGVLTDLASFAADLLAGYITGAFELHPGNYRKDTADFIEWVLAIVPDFFATQRRRYYGRGS